MSILLTSTGLSYPKAKKLFLKNIKNIKNKRAVILTTASYRKSYNKFSKLAKKQFLDLGVNSTIFFDLEKNKNFKLSKNDILYICGGNTFKLMKAIKSSNFNNQLISFLRNGGFCIGVSAGSIVLGPNIETAGIGVDGDINDVGLNDFSGLNIVSFSIFPHYIDKHRNELAKFSKSFQYKIKILTDEDAVYINKPI